MPYICYFLLLKICRAFSYRILKKGEIISDDCELLISCHEIVQYINSFQSNTSHDSYSQSKSKVKSLLKLVLVSSLKGPIFLTKLLESKGLSIYYIC